MNNKDDGEVNTSDVYNLESAETKRQDLKIRLREYALRIIRLYESMPNYGAVHVITHQLLRSGISPGAHYREAYRAKSNADFISKIEGALQELDESDYRLDLLIHGGFVSDSRLKALIDETNELIAIFVSMALKPNPENRDKFFIPHLLSFIP